MSNEIDYGERPFWVAIKNHDIPVDTCLIGKIIYGICKNLFFTIFTFMTDIRDIVPESPRLRASLMLPPALSDIGFHRYFQVFAAFL